MGDLTPMRAPIVGDIVEWIPWFAPGISRGRVTKIVDGTVHVMMPCSRKYRGEVTWYESEVYFEPHETNRLRVVGLVDTAALATLAANLKIGAALCETWQHALDESEAHRLYHEHGYRTGGCWSPGCQRPVP